MGRLNGHFFNIGCISTIKIFYIQGMKNTDISFYEANASLKLDKVATLENFGMTDKELKKSLEKSEKPLGVFRIHYTPMGNIVFWYAYRVWIPLVKTV